MKQTAIRLTEEITRLNRDEAEEAALPPSTYMRWKLGQEAPWKKLKEKQKKLALDALRMNVLSSQLKR